MNSQASADKRVMTSSSKIVYLFLIFAFGLTSGCANTNFSSSSGGKKEKPANQRKDGGLNNSADLGQNSDGKDGEDGETDEGGVDNDNDSDLGNISEEVQFDECLVKKADNYNINLIFDNSGSQKKNDPNGVRRDGAINFVEQFSKFAKRNKKSRVYFSVLSFNTKSIRGGQAWVKLTGDNAESIKSEITQATNNPNGGTAYSPVLRDAAMYFTELKKSVSSQKAKNYVVFLTDGLPNAASSINSIFFPQGSIGGTVETMEDIPKAIDALVNQHEVAIVAIASGDGIPSQGENITQSLAKPTTGKTDKSHVGIYKRARTTDDLKDVWKSLFGAIGNCD
jgi:hypothetical protein